MVCTGQTEGRRAQSNRPIVVSHQSSVIILDVSDTPKSLVTVIYAIGWRQLKETVGQSKTRLTTGNL